MKQRLEQFISAENLTQSQFADKIGVARANLSHIMSGRNNPGYDFFIQTSNAFPDLNLEWLMTGHGRMYKDTTLRQDSSQPELPFDKTDSLLSPLSPAASSPVAADAAGQLKTAPGIKKIVLLYEDNSFEEFVAR